MRLNEKKDTERLEVVVLMFRSHLQRLSEESPLLHFCPLDALQTELHLLTRGSLHVQEEVQQRANQPGRLGLGDGVQEGPDILQQAPKLCKKNQRWGKERLKMSLNGSESEGRKSTCLDHSSQPWLQR